MNNFDRFAPMSEEDYFCRNKTWQETLRWRTEQKRINGELTQEEIDDIRMHELWAEDN